MGMVEICTIIATLGHGKLKRRCADCKPCRHGQAMLTPPSRGSRGFGTTRARVFGMALHTFVGSCCTHGGGADMLCHVAGSSGFRPPSHLGCGRCQPAHARLRGAAVAARLYVLSISLIGTLSWTVSLSVISVIQLYLFGQVWPRWAWRVLTWSGVSGWIWTRSGPRPDPDPPL